MDTQTYVPRIEETTLKRNRAGNWEIRWTVPTDKSGTGRARTRSQSCNTSDFKLASTVRREYLATLSTASATLVQNTVDVLIGYYLRDHVDANGVSDAQRWSLKAVRRLLGHLEPGNITASDIAQYRLLRNVDVKLGTIRRELGALRAVLGWASREGHLPRGFVLPHIALPPEGQARTSFLTSKEEARFHDDCELEWSRRSPLERAALFTVIALNTAARAESIENLTWDRVDLVGKLIDFSDKSLRSTKKRRATVPVSDRLLYLLEIEWQVKGKPTSGPVLGRFGSTRRGFAALTAKYLPGRGITRHDLRRTWATLAAQRGVSMFDIAGVLGDTVETVTKHYAVNAPGYLRDAINKRA